MTQSDHIKCLLYNLDILPKDINLKNKQNTFVENAKQIEQTKKGLKTALENTRKHQKY